MCSHNSFKISNLHKARHYLTQLHTHFTHRELLVLLCKISSLAEVIVLISTALRRDRCTTEHCIFSHAICLAPLLQRCCQVVLITLGSCAKAVFFFFFFQVERNTLCIGNTVFLWWFKQELNNLVDSTELQWYFTKKNQLHVSELLEILHRITR